MRKYLCAALSPQTCKKRLRTASAVSVSAELSMIAQTSEQRTLLTFCSAFAKCPKYGERLGAITQGEDLTSGTLRCAGVLYFFALCGMALRCADAIYDVLMRRTLSPPTAYL